ncbi:MAG: hypothetical protein HYT98_01140 [Candidatus Sungbacteria bacterium]|nr:hypothetical protein [Candidatus Sungbacteria bacterium]
MEQDSRSNYSVVIGLLALCMAVATFFIGRLTAYEDGWSEGRQVIGEFYASDKDLRGWDVNSVDIGEKFRVAVSKELDLLRVLDPLPSYAFGVGYAVHRKTKKPVLLTIAREGFTNPEIGFVAHVYMEDMEKRVDPLKFSAASYSYDEFVKDMIGDDAKRVAKDLYVYLKNFK